MRSSPTLTFSPSDLCLEAGWIVHQQASPVAELQFRSWNGQLCKIICIIEQSYLWSLPAGRRQKPTYLSATGTLSSSLSTAGETGAVSEMRWHHSQWGYQEHCVSGVLTMLEWVCLRRIACPYSNVLCPPPWDDWEKTAKKKRLNYHLKLKV